jgi:hypothetical protein
MPKENKTIIVTEDFKYSVMCLESYPCQHYVTIGNTEDDSPVLMNGLQIYKYCIDNELDVPDHFKQYADFD